MSCLGFGFAKTFWQAMLFRSMGGALNGNVGVMRTMISEIVQEKRCVNISNRCESDLRQADINLGPFCFSRCASILAS